MLLQVFRRIWTRKPCWSLTPGDVLQREEKREENIKAVVERHPNTAGSSPQSASILRRASKAVEMTTFCECPLALILGQYKVVSRREKLGRVPRGAAVVFVGGSGPTPSCYSSSQVGAEAQQRTGSSFESSTACCRPPGVTAPLASPWWSGCFDVSL